MSDAALAKSAQCKHINLDRLCYRCADAFADEQTAALTKEVQRLTMKVEQYQTQLDDRWAGVVGVTNQHVAEITALRAALQEILDGELQVTFPNVHTVAQCHALLARQP